MARSTAELGVHAFSTTSLWRSKWQDSVGGFVSLVLVALAAPGLGAVVTLP